MIARIIKGNHLTLPTDNAARNRSHAAPIIPSAPDQRETGGITLPDREHSDITRLAINQPVERKILVGAIIVGIAIATRFALLGLEGRLVYLTFYPAVAISALAGGLPAGLTAAFISTAIANLYLTPQHDYLEWIGLAVFAISSALIIGMASLLHRSRARLAAADVRLSLTQALEEREARLRTMGDNLPDSAIYTYTHNNGEQPQFLYISSGIQRLSGLTPDEVLRDGGALHRRIEPEYYPQLMEAERRSASELADFHIEVPMRRTDGEVRWMSLRSRPRRLPDGSVVWDGVQTDITDQKRSEEALRISEARFRSLTLATSNIVWTVGSEKRAGSEHASCSWQTFTGQTAEETSGHGWLDAIHPDDRDRIAQVWQQAVTSKTTYRAEYRLRRWDGTYRWMAAKGVPMVADDGKVSEWIGTSTDITERKRAEERLQLLLREVNHRSKNLLAVIQSIAMQTAAATPHDFLARFSSRLTAMAVSQDLLVRNGWEGVALNELVRLQLGPFRDLMGDRISLHGSHIEISAVASQTLGMALHELVTNAGKYGALSSRRGRVAIAWETDNEQFSLTWTETDGPLVTKPARRGFGTTVLTSVPQMELDATVELSFPDQGLRWHLTCPLASVAEAGRA